MTVRVTDADGASDDSVVAFMILPEPIGGALVIESGDFGEESLQTVGYPNFVYLESFISMPLGMRTKPSKTFQIHFKLKIQN